MERERIIELFAGGIFIALLLIVALLVINPGTENDSKTTIISNSFNTYSTYSEGYPSGSGRGMNSDYSYDYYYGNKYRDMDYYDTGRSRHSMGLLGNDIARYSVYVGNRESQGGYFTVKFYFKDDYGRTRTESVTKYISPHDSEKFSYQKVYDDNYHYWKYGVVSDSRVPVAKKW